MMTAQKKSSQDPFDLTPFWVTTDIFSVPHGFFGASRPLLPPFDGGDYGSYGLKQAHSSIHQARAMTLMGRQNHSLFLPKQHHTTEVMVLEDYLSLEALREKVTSQPSDALVTSRKDVVLGVLTADCCPILLWNPCGMIAAIHGGWRGVCSGVIKNVVQAMEKRGAKTCLTQGLIGPTIRLFSYEVGEDFPRHITDPVGLASLDRLYVKKWGTSFFNLGLYVQLSLESFGVRVTDLGLDTFGASFFSRRYALYHHHGENETLSYGLNLSAISL